MGQSVMGGGGAYAMQHSSYVESRGFHQLPLGASFHSAPQQYFAAPASAVVNSGASETKADRAMMAELEESMGSMLPVQNDSSDEDDREKTPAEATEQEKEEAEQIVRLAFKEAKKRDKLREKVKKCGQADLQALLNARLDNKRAIAC